jgi:hypothetical protein
MQVFDWSAGAFVPVTGRGADPTATVVPLTQDQVRNGLVRVRMGEPRLSWATNVWVDARP